jgi:hypothetical protein
LSRFLVAHQGSTISVAADLKLYRLLVPRGNHPSDRIGGAGTEEVACETHITQSRGQGYPRNGAARHEFDAMQKRLKLTASLSANERVELINHDVPQ